MQNVSIEKNETIVAVKRRVKQATSSDTDVDNKRPVVSEASILNSQRIS